MSSIEQRPSWSEMWSSAWHGSGGAGAPAVPPVQPQEPASGTHAGDGSTFSEVQATEEFQGLKRTLRRFVFPATVVFLSWYVLYILLTIYARDFMSTEVFGNINVAYLFGLSQFVSTFVIAYVYSKYADKHFDPTADAIRHRLEGTQP